jgi:cytoskeletal protein CcmA (bactofilin family)
MKYLNNKNGAALVVMLFTAAIISMIGMAFISTSFREYKISHYEGQSVTAHYAAEGGLQKALVALKKYPHWKSNSYWDTLLGQDVPLGDGTYVLSLADKDGNVVEVTSKGKVGSAVKILKADVKITKVNKIFENLLAINSDSAVTLSGNADIYGDMYSNTDIAFSGNTKIYGDMTCLGETKLNGSQTIEGDLYSGENITIAGGQQIGGSILGRGDLKINGNPNINGTIQINGEIDPKDKYDVVYGGVGKREPIEFPKLTERLIESYRSVALEEGTYYEDGFFPDYISGTSFVEGSIDLSGNKSISGSGIILINGNLNITGNTSIKSDKDEIILVIATGYINISGNKDLECICFTPNELIVSGNVDLHGSIAAENVTGNGNLTIRAIEDIHDKLPDNSIGEFETYVDIISLKY